MDVTIGVATFGGEEWVRLARERAIPSAEAQGVPVIHRHAATLADARNAVLADTDTEYVVHLDADDQLEPGYVDALASGTADLRAPAVRYVTAHREHEPRMPRVAGHHHACTADCLPDGNWLVVGTAARTRLLRDVGGWEEWPLYEDWALWLRCWHAGATVEAIPAAVYRAHVRADSRNRAPSPAEKDQAHQDIRRACLPEAAAA